MNLSQGFSQIRQQVAAAVGSTPTQYDEQAFVQPDNKIWVRATILPAKSSKPECGVGSRLRHRGILILGVFGPKNKGDGDVWALVDTLKPSFRNKRVSGILWGTPDPHRVDNDSNCQINLSCDFQFEEN